MFTIEKNVPIPERGHRTTKYPFRSLEVGDSFFIPDKSVHQLAGSLSSWKKATGYKYASRAEDGGTRIWRTH